MPASHALMQNSDMNEPRIKTFLTVVPVLSAGLYLFGATYLQGYLDAFGIDDSMFPASIDRLLFSGFVALVTFGMLPLVYAFMALLTLVAAVLLAVFLSSSPLIQKWQACLSPHIRRMRYNRESTPAANAMLDKSAAIYVHGLGIFGIALLLFLLTVLSFRTGTKQAEQEMEKFSKKEGNYVQLLTDMTPTPIKAKQVICGATYCAFWSGYETLLVRHEQVRQISAHAEISKLRGDTPHIKTP